MVATSVQRRPNVAASPEVERGVTAVAENFSAAISSFGHVRQRHAPVTMPAMHARRGESSRGNTVNARRLVVAVSEKGVSRAWRVRAFIAPQVWEGTSAREDSGARVPLPFSGTVQGHRAASEGLLRAARRTVAEIKWPSAPRANVRR